MSASVIQIDGARVRTALARFSGSVYWQRRAQLMQTIGMGQLKSVYQTFADEGSPGGSWPALAPSTVKKLGGKAAGHKLLIGKCILRNSIRVQSDSSRAIVGTGLVYAAVHQYGSKDRGSVAIGPRTEEQSKALVKVKAHSYVLRPELESRNKFMRAEGPAREGKRPPRVRYSLFGPRNLSRKTILHGGRREARAVAVRAHERHQNIPARPYLVFRPEDPERIEEQVNLWIKEQASDAGLAVN